MNTNTHVLNNEWFLCCTGRRSDKKPPNLAQTLSFLSHHLAQTQNFLIQKFKKQNRSHNQKAWRSRGVQGGGSPPEGGPSLPFQAADHSLQEMVSPGLGLDLQAKKSWIQPQDFLSIDSAGGARDIRVQHKNTNTAQENEYSKRTRIQQKLTTDELKAPDMQHKTP